MTSACARHRTGLGLPALGIAVSLAIAFALYIDIFTTFEYGGDEGYELIKALLLSNGFALYDPVWNDQPPLHTWAVSLLFRMFGPSAGLARTISIAMGAGLILLVYDLVRSKFGPTCGAVSAVCLLAWPSLMELSASVMLEVPTMFMGMASLRLLFGYVEFGKRPYLALSGLVFGLGLGTKLTIALFGPAALLLLGLPRSPGGSSQASLREEPLARRFVRNCTWWGSAMILGLGCILGLALSQLPPDGRAGLSVLLESHLSASVAKALAQSKDYSFGLQEFIETGEFFCAAAIGVWVAVRSRSVPLMVPILIFLTGLAVHSFHRPYWPYYTVHFGVPVCWLAGIGSGGIARVLRAGDRSSGRSELFFAGAGALIYCTICALAITRVANGLLALRDRPRVEEVRLVRSMRDDGRGDRWVFTDRPIFAFHARKLIPPEIALLPAKRFWGGQLKAEKVLEIAVQRGASRIAVFHPDLRATAGRAPLPGYVANATETDFDEFVLRTPPAGAPNPTGDRESQAGIGSEASSAAGTSSVTTGR